jgi:cysteinyl-tRNA synthetase
MLSIAVGLLADKFKQLQGPLTNKLKEAFNTIKDYRSGVTAGLYQDFDKTGALKTVDELIAKQRIIVSTKMQSDKVTAEELAKEQQTLQVLQQQKEVIENTMSKREAIGAVTSAAGTALQTAGLGISAIDQDLGAFTSMLGTGTKAVGQFIAGD